MGEKAQRRKRVKIADTVMGQVWEIGKKDFGKIGREECGCLTGKFGQ